VLSRKTVPLHAAAMTSLFGLGLVSLGGVSLAQSSSASPSAHLTGYVVEVSGATVRLSLKKSDGVQIGDEFSALQYGEEIARLRVSAVSANESIAEMTLQKPGALLRVLDEVVRTKAVANPATDLQPPPPTLPSPRLRPRLSPKRETRVRDDEGEIVSRADWAYPALSTLAEHHLLPGVDTREFHGDQQLTRAEIRRLITEAIETAKALSQNPFASQNSLTNNADSARPSADRPVAAPKLRPGDARLLQHLAQSYQVMFDLPDPGNGIAFSHYSRYRVASGDEPTFSSDSAYEGMLSLGKNEYAVVSLSKARREWYGDRSYPWLNEAFFHTRWLGADWEIGNRALRWGPGYSGSLTLSDVTPSLPMIRGQIGWSLGKLGYWKVDQFVSRFSESGDAKYLIGRRIAHPINRNLTLGLSETAKSDKAPNPSILFLPLLAYQRVFEKDTNVINVMDSLDLHYRNGAAEVYGELFIDDLTAPAGFRSAGKVPRKVGYLVGWRRANLFGAKGPDLRVEYARTDQNTYLHRNPPVSYYDDGFPLGHPMGPNAKSLLVRADRRLSPRVEVMGAVQFLSQTKTPPPDSAKGTAATFGISYDFRNDRSVTLKVSPGRRVDRYDAQTTGTVEFIADWKY
jgi:hypothetical protein